jgi:hypothetical protein
MLGFKLALVNHIISLMVDMITYLEIINTHF